MNEKLQKFISDVGDVGTAANILDISKISLKKYIEENNIPDSIWNKKILPIVNSSTQGVFKILANRINGAKQDIKDLDERNHELTIENYKYEKLNQQLSRNLKKVLESPLISYVNYYGYRDNPVEQVEKTIDQLIADKNFSELHLYYSMEEFARVYELFRPTKITTYDYYWGTVKTMDGIYALIYGGLLRIEPKIFSRVTMTSFMDRFDTNPYAQIEFNKINWALFKANLSSVCMAIRNTINQESIKLFIGLGKNIPYQVKYFLKDYIQTFFKGISDNEIEIDDTNERTIIIKGEKIVFESERQFHSILVEKNNK